MTRDRSDGRTIRAQQMREVRREEILDAASRVFGERGYHATTVADLIRAAGVSRGTFYLYFQSREAVLHELLDRLIVRLTAAVSPVRPDQGQAMRDLYANVERLVRELYDNRHLTRLLFREAVGLDAQVDARLNRLDTHMYDMIFGALRKGMEWNLIRRVENTEVVAAALVGNIREVLYQSLVTHRFGVTDPASVARTVFDMCFYGVAREIPRPA